MFFLAEKFTFAGSELISIGSGSVNFGCFFFKNKNKILIIKLLNYIYLIFF
jgi:hypothetical protein